MTSSANSQNVSNQAKRTSFSGLPSNNASILLDRAKVGVRGSTPDSEALASSDDEHDHLQRLQTVTSNPGMKPHRRPSWLNENQQSISRQQSAGAVIPFSPVSPATVTSSVEQTPWSTNSSTASLGFGRGHSSNSSFPWSNTIWNSEAQKGPPQRLAEVLPSPTTTVPPNSAGLSQDENSLRSPSLARDYVADPSIPFSIPLQPTLKSYRSQSYSVGQIDTEPTANPSSVTASSNLIPASKRVASYAGLHHRPSRPSLLGDTVHDTNTLGQLREVEDDEEALSVPASTSSAHHADAKTIEDLAGENAMLRQQLFANQLQQGRSNHGSFTSQRPQLSGQYYHQRLPDQILERGPGSLHSLDSRKHYSTEKLPGSLGRRFSEYGTSSGPHYALNVGSDHRTYDQAKRGQWQSSLGFARVEEPPQSRRHSFAEMPTRHNSLSSAGEEDITNVFGDFNISPRALPKRPEDYAETTNHQSQGDHAQQFSQTSRSPGNSTNLQSTSSSSLNQSFGQIPLPRMQHMSSIQSRAGQCLYIVTFKCLRADVFYVQESTGLRVNKGDLVIVEADRGTDLGTVQSDPVSWSEAKQMKDEYTQKHHEWLMAFSHHTQNGTVAGPNPNGPSLGHSLPGHAGGSGFNDLLTGEIKPKMIKRLAQMHEIGTLREKEGGEAKAKRMCQQKVVDHRLNMEILDAEFQMDWKKLTFFYFADAYINFNPLVTDLFKIYKTRIWMSAINTAAIASHHAGIRPPGLPPRHGLSPEYNEFRNSQFSSAGTGNSQQVPFMTFNNPYENDTMIGGAMNFDQMYAPPQPFHQTQSSPISGDVRSTNQHASGISPQFRQPGSYGASNFHVAPFNPQHENDDVAHQNRQIAIRDWNQSFQAMSLGR